MRLLQRLPENGTADSRPATGKRFETVQTLVTDQTRFLDLRILNHVVRKSLEAAIIMNSAILQYHSFQRLGTITS